VYGVLAALGVRGLFDCCPALESAAVNVDINVVSLKDAEARERLASALNEALQAKVQADAIMQAVARRIRA
jgi:formiminotetrahydrofolate cyclodeaminase